MSRHVKVIAVLRARPGRAAGLKALLGRLVGPSRAEPGNLRYDLWADASDPARFVLDELYEDASANEAHRGSAHFQAYRAGVDALAEREAIVLEAVDVG